MKQDRFSKTRRDVHWVVLNCYREQLRKFNALGIGKETEHKVVVTENLIAITEKRLGELSLVNFKPIKPMEAV